MLVVLQRMFLRTNSCNVITLFDRVYRSSVIKLLINSIIKNIITFKYVKGIINNLIIINLITSLTLPKKTTYIQK